jgi:hypothetical protein
MPSVFAGAFGSALAAVGVWNFVSSRRPSPSGVRTIATSTRTSSSPTTRSTQRPSTVASPSSSRPSSRKNAVASLKVVDNDADVVHPLDRHVLKHSATYLTTTWGDEPEVSLPRPNPGTPSRSPSGPALVAPELGEVVEEQDTVVRERSLMSPEGCQRRAVRFCPLPQCPSQRGDESFDAST